MRIVVTGGAGFIGSHLVHRLMKTGNDVIVVDDFSRGNERNLVDLGIDTQVEGIDLRDYGQVADVFKGADVVYHLAAKVGSLLYLHGNETAELETLQSNLAIDTNVFRSCAEQNVKKIIYASSVSVYPIDLQQKQGVTFSENDLTYINPEGGYGWAKYLGEIQLSWMKKVKASIARVFNIYGECAELLGENSQVIPALIRKAIMYPKEDFIVWGSGKQTRCFLYVSDCIDALLKLELEASNPPLIVNIGSDEFIAASEIAKRIVTLSKKNIKIRYDSSRPVGPVSRTANITKAKQMLNWSPSVSFDQGLKRTYQWAEKRLLEK
jgi:GDP-D-mannose 3', 5'-epimerase